MPMAIDPVPLAMLPQPNAVPMQPDLFLAPAENAAPVASYAQAGHERLTHFVFGGTFSKQIDEELVADGFEQVKAADGQWTVQKKA